jgi:predicted 3-demethylubiquinone-9 3-methyltransferase (glyoxalase superfamily)
VPVSIPYRADETDQVEIIWLGKIVGIGCDQGDFGWYFGRWGFSAEIVTITFNCRVENYFVTNY